MRIRFVFAGALALFCACTPSNDTLTGTSSLVPITDPLPVPAGTIVAPDNTNKVAVGAIAGTSGVSSDGQAHYEIPIWVPPGRVGMEPELALRYQSRSPDGIVGVGWSLTGFSQITRCPYRYEVDGRAAPVRFKADDALCLDGERLKQAGTSGSTTYFTTERTRFQRVEVPYDSNGPLGTIIVREKNGRILTYTGYTLGRAVNVTWVLTQVADQYGNTMLITYLEDHHYLYPTEIDYTGSLTNTALKANRQVKFGYEKRYVTRYSGALGDSEMTLELNKIDLLWTPDSSSTPVVLRSYSLQYQRTSLTGSGPFPGTTQAAKLIQLAVSDGNGVRLGTTDFEWEQGAWGFTPIDTTTTDFDARNANAAFRLTDIDGDGHADLLYMRRVGTNPSQYAVRLWNDAQQNFDSAMYIDREPVPGVDGKLTFPQPAIFAAAAPPELVMWMFPTGVPTNEPTPVIQQLTTHPDRTVTADAYLPFDWKATIAFPADFDGDGLADMMLGYSNASSGTAPLYFRRNLGTNPLTFDQGVAMPMGPLGTLKMAGATVPMRGMDFDGDGRQELALCWNDDHGNSGSVLVNADGAKQSYAIDCGFGLATPMYLDLNGDGLDDVLYPSYTTVGATSTWVRTELNPDPTAVSSGGAALRKYDQMGWSFGGAIRAIDYDNDGVNEIIATRLGFSPYTTIAQFMPTSAGIERPQWPWFQGDSLPVSSDAANVLEVGDVNGDGLQDVVIWDKGKFTVYLRNGNKPDMLTRIVDGVGAETRFEYRPISDLTVYTPTSIDAFGSPFRAVNGGVWVVSKHSVSNGVAKGSLQTFIHKYESGAEDVQGRGFLGFRAHHVLSYDAQGHLTELDEAFNPTYRFFNLVPFPNLPVAETTTVYGDGGAILHVSAVYRTWSFVFNDANNTYAPYPRVVEEKDSDPDSTGKLVTTFDRTTTVTGVDAYGNEISETVTDPTGETRSTTTTYQNDYANWLINQPTKVIQTSDVNGKHAVRTIAYKYDGHGSVEWKAIEPSVDSSGNLTPLPQPQPDGVSSMFEHYLRDPDGQINTITSDRDLTPTVDQRVTTIHYDTPARLFPTRITDKHGHSLHLAMHEGLGLVAASEDDNGVYNTFVYDTFGRLKAQNPGGGESSALKYLGYVGLGVDGTKPSLELHEASAGGAATYLRFDLLNREVSRKVFVRDDGKASTVQRTYDDQGRLVTVTRPQLDGATATPASDQWVYDPVGRVKRRVYADGRVEQKDYRAFQIDTWDADPSDPTVGKSTLTFDAAGHVASSVRHAAAKDGRPARDLAISYQYGPFSTLDVITSLNNVTISATHDRLGREINVVDPSSGSTANGYNAFGELANTMVTTTAGSETRQLHYDDLGRPDWSTTRDGTTTWTWDVAPNGIGKLASVTGPTGVATSFTYDSQSRLTDETWTLHDEAFQVSHVPDTLGRLSKLLYPTVNGSRLTVRYEYGAHGSLEAIKDDATNAPYWTLLETNASGVPTNASGLFPQYTLGNGIAVHEVEDAKRPGFLGAIVATAGSNTLQSLTYGFNSKGFLSLKRDELRGLQEKFDYDELDRLEHWDVTSQGGPSRVRYDYNDQGDLVGRTYEVGSGANATFGYGQVRGAGPYAITDAGSLLYGYDPEGNQVSAGIRRSSFNAIGLPNAMLIGITGAGLNFDYDGDGARVYKRYQTALVPPRTDEMVSIAGLYYRRTVSGATEHHFTIAGPRGPIAQVITDGSGNRTLQYILRDHLGSADTIVDGATSTVVETRKFDPWGNAFDPLNPLNPAPSWSSSVPYGFTGHEHDLEYGLINMNGRIYDPKNGRFLTPDVHRDSIFTVVGLNAYAYAGDNPVSFTDPTGYDSDNGDGSQPPIGIGPLPGPLPGGPTGGRNPPPVTTGPARGGTSAPVYNPVAQNRIDYNGSPYHATDSNNRVGAWVSEKVSEFIPPDFYEPYRRTGDIVPGRSGMASLMAMNDRIADQATVAFEHQKFWFGEFAKLYAECTAILGEMGTIMRGASLLEGSFGAMSRGIRNTPSTQNVAQGAIRQGGNAAEEVAESSRILHFSERNLQKGFTKHGGDFGLSGNWNPSRAAEFSQAVNEHINAPAVQAIQGTYRGAPVIHYLTPSTGVNVMADPLGNYVSGWKLGTDQLKSVLASGRLF